MPTDRFNLASPHARVTLPLETTDSESEEMISAVEEAWNDVMIEFENKLKEIDQRLDVDDDF